MVSNLLLAPLNDAIAAKNSSSKTPINAHICFAADKFDKL